MPYRPDNISLLLAYKFVSNKGTCGYGSVGTLKTVDDCYRRCKGAAMFAFGYTSLRCSRQGCRCDCYGALCTIVSFPSTAGLNLYQMIGKSKIVNTMKPI